MSSLFLRAALAFGLGVFLTSGPAAGAVGDETAAPKAEKPAIKVAELVLRGDGGEDPKPRQPFGQTPRNFRLQLERIRSLAADPEIRAVQLEIKGLPGMAKTLDLLDELDALKAAGKTLICYTEMLDRNTALVASLADHLVVPPSGLIILEGLLAEMMYFKNLLDSLDVRVEVLNVGDFKTAFENFSRESMSAGQAESIGEILDEYYGQIVRLIAENRGLSEEAVEALFGRLLIAPEEAAAAGLIDAAMYEDEFKLSVEQFLGGKYELVKNYGDVSREDVKKALESPFGMFLVFQELINPPKEKTPEKPYLGVVYCTGSITSGKSKSDFSGNVSSMGSETIVAQLRKFEEDENCKAVVLRVNSPGGSALASDMIWRAIERVKAKKPVVSSMGSVAASGGYWISMGCTAIVAQPSTLTGSIGVVSMLPDVHATLKRFGVNVEVVARGPHGDQLSLLKNGPTDVLREMLTRFMQDTYEEFLAKVSVGRRLPVERVRELARGRVWTGRQAAEAGLVDQLGSLQDALELARGLGRLPPDASLVEGPKAPDFFTQLEEAFQVVSRPVSPLEALLYELGFEQALATARELLKPRAPLDPERVQAILPFDFILR